MSCLSRIKFKPGAIIERIQPRNIGYHHTMMLFLGGATALYSTLLASCTSSTTKSIYLVSLKYSENKLSSPTAIEDSAISNKTIAFTIGNSSAMEKGFEVRTGYRGLCALVDTHLQFCSTDASNLVDLVRGQTTRQGLGNFDPLNLVYVANHFRKQIIFDGLIFIAIIFSFLAIIILSFFPSWHEETADDGEEVEIKAFPNWKLLHSSVALSIFALFFGFTATFWQQIGTSSAASMVEALYYGGITAHTGPRAMAIGWIGVGLSSLAAFGLTTMALSISLIKRLTDASEEDEEN